MTIVVDGWYHETHEGPRCEFACIEHNHCGFALPREDVESLSEKLAVLLESGECRDDTESVIHVDWSEGVEGWVMIAFRPTENSKGRFYDLPRDIAVVLLEKLRRLLEE